MTTAPGLATLVQERQMDEAAVFEQQVAAEAVGDADDRMAELMAAAAALWVSAFGSATAVGAGAELTKLLRSVSERIGRALAGLGDRARRAIVKALPAAMALGAEHARGFLRAAGLEVADTAGSRARMSQAAVREAARLEEMVREQLNRSRHLLSTGESRFPSVAAALQVARTAVSRVRSAVAWLVHQEAARGAGAVAEQLGLGRLWVAEVDACARCAAYSGEIAAPGEDFEGGRSFDPRQRGYGPATVTGVPLHPRCRCQTMPWNPQWPSALPGLLRRRAAEHVAAGDALPSESGAARVRAAAAVLASGRALPSRVRARAQQAVREGRFPQVDRAA